MTLRGHEPILIEQFNGLWVRGDQDAVPSDHFSDGNNLQFIESGFEWRDGLDTLVAKGNIVRMYNYKMQNGESLIALDGDGNIWHSLLDGSGTIYGPVLTIAEMEDFGFIAYAGRAYITPYKTFVDLNGTEYQKGLENEFVYVYKGDGTAARKAAGAPPTNSDDTPMIAFNNPLVGLIEEGIRILAVTFSDGADDSTSLGPTVLPTIYAPGDQSIQLTNIPIGGVGITQRKIWSTKIIPSEEWTANYADFTFYLVTTVNDNTTTSAILSFEETDLTVPFVAGSLPNPTSGGLEVRNVSIEGHCTLGLHIIAVVFETDTGYLSAPGPEVFGVQTFIDERKSITVSNIPVSADSFVVKRHLVASRAIVGYNGNDHDYQLFFIPGGTLEDNVTTELNISFFDGELLDDASHLMDNFSEIPAGVTLTTYHSRMALSTTFSDISVFYFSAPGEPEAIDQVDGVVIAPLEGNPLTIGQEYRDIFYMFKKVRTYAVIDNGDVPSTWSVTTIDNGIGASIHGIATVLDSGGINIEFLIIVDFSGMLIFNGLYQRPELSWKILNLWTSMNRNFFSAIQILNDSLTQIIYMTLPNGRILIGDYKNGLNPKDIRWMTWSFDIEANTIALFNTNTLAIGSGGDTPPVPPDPGDGGGSGGGGGPDIPPPDPTPPPAGSLIGPANLFYMGAIRLNQTGSNLQFSFGGLALRKVGGKTRFIILQDKNNEGFAPAEFESPAEYDSDGNLVSGSAFTPSYTVAPVAPLITNWGRNNDNSPYSPYHDIAGQWYNDVGVLDNDITSGNGACWNCFWDGSRLHVMYGALYGTYHGWGNMFITLDNPDDGVGPVTTAYGPFNIESPGNMPYPSSTPGNVRGLRKSSYFLKTHDGGYGHGGAQAGSYQQGFGPDGPSLYLGFTPPTEVTPSGFPNYIATLYKGLNFYTLNGIMNPADGSLLPGQPIWSFRQYGYPYPYEASQGGYLAINPALNNGIGTWTETDEAAGMVYVNVNGRHGYIAIMNKGSNHNIGSNVTTCTSGGQTVSHNWYAAGGNPLCDHGCTEPAAITGPVTTHREILFAIYDPAKVDDVKNGVITDYSVDPVNYIYPTDDMNSNITLVGEGTTGPHLAGVAKDEDNNMFYILALQRDDTTFGFTWPVIYAFQVR